MDKGTNKKISDFIAYIALHNKRLQKAYLFGSYAKKNDKEYSDIDLALIIDKLDDEERFDLQVQLMIPASDFDIRIEPHPISNENFSSGNPFAEEIIKTGVEIEPEKPDEWHNSRGPNG